MILGALFLASLLGKHPVKAESPAAIRARVAAVIARLYAPNPYANGNPIEALGRETVPYLIELIPTLDRGAVIRAVGERLCALHAKASIRPLIQTFARANISDEWQLALGDWGSAAIPA